jgi:hypothetical protein
MFEWVTNLFTNLSAKLFGGKGGASATQLGMRNRAVNASTAGSDSPAYAAGRDIRIYHPGTARTEAEAEAGAGTEFREIADGEIRHGLSVAERVAILELEKEFGCKVKTDVKVAAGDKWANFHAAVVRGETLVAIEIQEYKGGGFPYFQIDHLAKVGSEWKFDRFHGFMLYVAVISDLAQTELDDQVKAGLEEVARKAPCKVEIRMYRLNPLRAKHGL